MTFGAVLTFSCLCNVLTSKNLCEYNTFACQAAMEVALYYPYSPFMVIIIILPCALPETLNTSIDDQLHRIAASLMVEWTDLFALEIVHVPSRGNKMRRNT